jgi:hypothetical protein
MASNFIDGVTPYFVNGQKSDQYVVLPNGQVTFCCNAVKMPEPFDLLGYWGIHKEEDREKVSSTAYMHLLVLAAKHKNYQNGKNIEAALQAPSPESRDLLVSKELVDAHADVIDKYF